MSNKIDVDIASAVTQKQALIRPFLRALNDAVNPVPVGLQFEIVSILGALKDPRCARTLFNLLKNTNLEYTNLLSNIIYVLGNLQFSEMSEYLKMILELPDYIDLPSGAKHPIYDIKSEAIWSTGKLGISERNLINEMVKYILHKDNTIKIALAWTMGMIGIKEKKDEGVVDLEIFTTLLELLKDKNKKVFEESIYGLKILGFEESKIYTFDFSKNLLRTLKISASPLSAIATDRNNIIATGHQDGTIRLWDINSKMTHLLKGHKNPIISIVIDKKGIIVSNSSDGELRLWNLHKNSIKIYNNMIFNTKLMGLERTSDNIIFVKENNVIRLDPENGTVKIISLPKDIEPIAFYPYYDGRIFAGYRKKDRTYFIVIEFKKDKGFYTTIRTDINKINGITTMGPRIIIAGMDNEGGIIEILRSENYVRGEIEKLKILKNSKRHFQYHSMIF